LGGKGWAEAAQKVAKDLGIKLETHVIGPRQDYVDHTGDWARAREIGDAGCILTRPDQHVCWRNDAMVDDPVAELTRVLTSILAR
jgi:2,4-dichlorophenol 6-monooxygenase